GRVLPPAPRRCMLEGGRRSTPNLGDPPPAGVLVRQRGAYSRIGIEQTFESPRGVAAGGRVARGPTKGRTRCRPIRISSASVALACGRRANPTPPPALISSRRSKRPDPSTTPGSPV